MNNLMQIAFTATKTGRPIAYRWSSEASGRWFRISLDEAKLRIATGRAREVKYTR